MWRLKPWLPATLCAFLSLTAFGGRAADEARNVEEAYQQALHSTAWVRVSQDNKLRKMGTGFLVEIDWPQTAPFHLAKGLLPPAGFQLAFGNGAVQLQGLVLE